MTLPASGTISVSQVNTELGNASNTQISLNTTAVRTLAGQARTNAGGGGGGAAETSGGTGGAGGAATSFNVYGTICTIGPCGGGGGWGAAGGAGDSGNVDRGGVNPKGGSANGVGTSVGNSGYPGAAGGKAIVTNGHAVTWIKTGNVYGIVG